MQLFFTDGQQQAHCVWHTQDTGRASPFNYCSDITGISAPAAHHASVRGGARLSAQDSRDETDFLSFFIGE